MKLSFRLLLCAGLVPFFGLAQPHWWMDEPVRLLQTNLRETDAALDAKRLVQQLTDFPANTLLFGLGGIVAYYPTRVPFHFPSPYMPPGKDLFGDTLNEAAVCSRLARPGRRFHSPAWVNASLLLAGIGASGITPSCHPSRTPSFFSSTATMSNSPLKPSRCSR